MARSDHGPTDGGKRPSRDPRDPYAKRPSSDRAKGPRAPGDRVPRAPGDRGGRGPGQPRGDRDGSAAYRDRPGGSRDRSAGRPDHRSRPESREWRDGDPRRESDPWRQGDPWRQSDPWRQGDPRPPLGRIRRWEGDPGMRRTGERTGGAYRSPRPGGPRPEREREDHRPWSSDPARGRPADRRRPTDERGERGRRPPWDERPRSVAGDDERRERPDRGDRRPPAARGPAGRPPVRRAWVPASPDAIAPPEHIAQDEELVAGRRPVEEAFTARRPARRLLVVPERRAALEQLVLHAIALRIPVVEVEGGSLTALTGFDGHQGIALVVEPRRWATIEEVVAHAAARGEPPFVLVLDSLEDPQNVGTLLRSAEACGVHGVVFPTRRSAPIGPAAIKASAGAVEHLLMVPLDDLGGGLVDLHAAGLRLVGADESAQLAYRDADMRGPLALVVGSEGRGIAGHVRRRLDVVVRIPMHGQVASLNAAVAGSVLLFEAAAQRPAPVRAPASDVTPRVAADPEDGPMPAHDDDAVPEDAPVAEPQDGPVTESVAGSPDDLLPGEPG